MRRRGFSLIEVLVAVVILGLALAGLLGLWTFGYDATRHSQDIGVAYNVARLEIEQSKAVGYMLLPEGTSAPRNYDGAGQPTTGLARYVATSTMVTFPDANGQINATCLRRLDVQVRGTERNEVVFATSTYFTQGGI